MYKLSRIGLVETKRTFLDRRRSHVVLSPAHLGSDNASCRVAPSAHRITLDGRRSIPFCSLSRSLSPDEVRLHALSSLLTTVNSVQGDRVVYSDTRYMTVTFAFAQRVSTACPNLHDVRTNSVARTARRGDAYVEPRRRYCKWKQLSRRAPTCIASERIPTGTGPSSSSSSDQSQPS